MIAQSKPDGGVERWEHVLTAGARAGIARSIQSTALMFGVRLSAECAEDLVQDVLLRLWQYGVLGKLETSPAYVRRVAQRTVIDAIRRRGAQKRTARKVGRVDAQGLSGSESRTPEEELLEREEFRIFVRRCRMQMSKRLFQAFALVYLAGLPQREAGRLVGLSGPSIYSGLSRFRRVLCESGNTMEELRHAES
jgi:RNA polymerase sigma factor (sigma-70 family)